MNKRIWTGLGVGAVLLGGCTVDDATLDIDAGADAGGDVGTDGSGGDSGSGAPSGPDRPEPTTDWAARTPLRSSFDTDGDEFQSTPWPADARTFDDGTVDLRDFPNANLPLVSDYRDVMEHKLVGFSNYAVGYFAFDDELDTVAVPTPAETLLPTSPIQLLALSPERCGERIPVETSPALEGDNYTQPNTLRVGPVYGFVLAPSEPYAFVVTRALGAEQGASAAQPEAVAQLLAGTHPDARWNASWAPLRDCLGQADLWPSEIATATVFTTQDPVATTRRMLAVANDDQTPSPQVVTWAQSDRRTTPSYTTFIGTVSLPLFQAGTPPYAAASDGGDLVLDETGTPVIQGWEDAPFSIAFPRTYEEPLPVLVWIDGTGAGTESHIGDPPFTEAIQRGFAVANVQPQFHAGRSGPLANDELHTFNYLNPAAGRTNFRQQAAEVSYFLRLLREGADQLEGIPQLDPDRIVYGGHSQGALVGAILAGVEPSLRGFFLNGVGAYLAVTIVERKDPFDIAQLVGSALDVGGPIDRFHPVTQLAQLGGDVVDPGNYARYWTGWDQNPRGSNVLMSNGNIDATTHWTSIATITVAGDAAPLAPAGFDVDPFDVWTRDEEAGPIAGNRTSVDGSPLTIVSYLRDQSGHFTIYEQPAVMEMGADFWDSAAFESPPVVNRP